MVSHSGAEWGSHPTLSLIQEILDRSARLRWTPKDVPLPNYMYCNFSYTIPTSNQWGRDTDLTTYIIPDIPVIRPPESATTTPISAPNTLDYHCTQHSSYVCVNTNKAHVQTLASFRYSYTRIPRCGTVQVWNRELQSWRGDKIEPALRGFATQQGKCPWCSRECNYGRYLLSLVRLW